MPKFRVDQYLTFLLLLIACLVQPGMNEVQQLALRVHPVKAAEKKLPTPPAEFIVPLYKGSLSLDEVLLDVHAAGVYVMDRDSGAQLFLKQSSQQFYPASTVKLMTALVARRLYKLDEVVTIREEAFTTGTVTGFKVGEQLTVETLLDALLISSGNDAAFVLANHHRLGYEGFLADMNLLARQLNLEKTFFENPSGLDSLGQQTTARDLAILAHEVMKDEVLRPVVGTRKKTITDITGEQVHLIHNTHELLGSVPGVVGIKTGTTESAGENLITEIDRDGHKIIIVVLGSDQRYVDTQQIVDWVFSQYEWETRRFPPLPSPSPAE